MPGEQEACRLTSNSAIFTQHRSRNGSQQSTQMWRKRGSSGMAVKRNLLAPTPVATHHIEIIVTSTPTNQQSRPVLQPHGSNRRFRTGWIQHRGLPPIYWNKKNVTPVR